MIATAIGYMLLAVGGAGVIATARKWRAYLAEIHIFATVAVFGGYALLPVGAGGETVRMATLALFLVSGASAIQKIWHFRGGWGYLGPGMVALALSVAGVWFVWI